MYGAMSLNGELDVQKVEDSFAQFINRHEILRTSFDMIDGEPVQIIHDKVEFGVNYIKADENEIGQIIYDFIKPFNLNSTPLIRVTLINILKNSYILLLDMHHIISDGISLGILIQDFSYTV
jgi:NRPS condensation-like uncharacterized protein